MSGWGFSNTELSVTLKVLDKLHKNPALLSDTDIRSSGVKKYLNDSLFSSASSFSPSGGQRSPTSMSPTARASSPKASSPTGRASSPVGRTAQNLSTMVIQDHTATGPSGASKYTGGSKPTFARTECSNHKYGGGGN
uniref:Uncharacterized protein n=1 Tax=Eutreptiella gymnastica TaxID=73025 RepID=A0A7S1NS41_9EUGL|mmetsp:Transcript_79007/g.139553  ORF Transcript_79007/g.139553 Transcript_79007/m.139553 type:complete len:137 (+) Transcript_79007:30-440(+)